MKKTFTAVNSLTVANFETAIPIKHQQTPNNTFRLAADGRYLSHLKSAGITHLGLANNHTFDFGAAGYKNIRAVASENALITFGHPTLLSTSSVTFLDTKSARVAVIAIHTLFAEPTSKNIKEVFDYAKSESSIQIVFIHWGDEYNLQQSNKQRSLAKVLAAAGADVVIGHHPHVVQGIEKIGDTIVFYSLGNYIFDQYFSTDVQQGLTLSLSLNEDIAISLNPVSSLEKRAQPRDMTDKNKEEFLLKLSQRSSPELVSQIIHGTIFLPLSLATSSEVAIMTE